MFWVTDWTGKYFFLSRFISTELLWRPKTAQSWSRWHLVRRMKCKCFVWFALCSFWKAQSLWKDDFVLFLCRLESSLEIQPTKPRLTYSVSILDLDPKPYDAIPYQHKLDSKIVNYYLRSTHSKQELSNSPSLLMEREDRTLVFHPVWNQTH